MESNLPGTNGDLDGTAGREEKQVDPTGSRVDEANKAVQQHVKRMKPWRLRLLEDVVLNVLLVATVLEHA